MQIVCPSCHARYALEAGLSEADARRVMPIAGRLPPSIAPLAFSYLGLFRPAQRSLSWRRTADLLGELADMIEEGGIRRRGRAWKADVTAFQTALETVLNRRDKLTLPLKNHGYLMEVLVGVVNGQEAKAERETETARRRPREQDRGPVSAAEVVEKNMRHQWDRELGLIDDGEEVRLGR